MATLALPLFGELQVGLTEDVEETIQRARKFALSKRHPTLVEMHIVYGLLSMEHGKAHDLLQQLGTPVEEILQTINEADFYQCEPKEMGSPEEIRLSMEAEQVLRWSWGLAQIFFPDEKRLDTDHILLDVTQRNLTHAYGILHRHGLRGHEIKRIMMGKGGR